MYILERTEENWTSKKDFETLKEEMRDHIMEDKKDRVKYSWYKFIINKKLAKKDHELWTEMADENNWIYTREQV